MIRGCCARKPPGSRRPGRTSPSAKSASQADQFQTLACQSEETSAAGEDGEDETGVNCPGRVTISRPTLTHLALSWSLLTCHSITPCRQFLHPVEEPSHWLLVGPIDFAKANCPCAGQK